ncbi:MAG: hypothetical protein A2604_02820 [Candidatus Liptonbacteria bacterium RIFOXYD1_FULL_36_11]|uniref:Uncharacterized protein n=1 Tax=Candidatus Liptonbacteria bacterium RIFOXYD1_FULL_36_11 TaxID=1798656 RepID=A0A1G2CRG6_9BACT|nr:MAG: hypothetical protein A2604_02820 [Candidatus Liptonbacteria bacterium RIFOXYD1_FULL_36_11]
MINKILIKKIEEMADVDQKTRKLWLKRKDKDFLQSIVYCLDIANNYLINKIIKEDGFPNEKSMGVKALKKFWILVQHQDMDVELQKKCLENCGFGLKEKAYLMDRILVGEGKKQIYGTQFYKNKEGMLVPRPIKDIKNIDKLRKSCNLEAFSKYFQKMSKFK